MGWGGNLEPTYDIPTVISDNSDKVTNRFSLHLEGTNFSFRIALK